MSVLDTTPAGTRAAMIDAALAERHPKLALPAIAHRFQVTLAELQTVLQHAGYPETGQMRAAAARLRAEADNQDPADTAPAAADEKPRMVKVAVADLHPDPNNLREHVTGVPSTDPARTSNRDAPVDDIEQLADSIREVGLLQPIIARRDDHDPDRLVVVAGHRRLAAIKRLRWTHVDVVIRPPMKPDHIIAAMLIENGQRRDLDPIEEARGIRQLKATEYLTDIQVARKIGRSQSYVSMRLALLSLTPEEQEQIRSGDMGLVGAAQLGRLKAGKVRQGSKGNHTIPYFGPTNDLASRAQARCKRLGHTKKLNGGVACGPCWESVIRADERDHLQAANAQVDDCVTCGQPIEREAAAS